MTDILTYIARRFQLPDNPHHGQFTAVSEATYYPENGEPSTMYVGHVDKHHSLLNIVGYVAGDEFVFMGSLDDTHCLVFVDDETDLAKAINVFNTLSEYAKELTIRFTVRLDESLTVVYPPEMDRVV